MPGRFRFPGLVWPWTVNTRPRNGRLHPVFWIKPVAPASATADPILSRRSLIGFGAEGLFIAKHNRNPLPADIRLPPEDCAGLHRQGPKPVHGREERRTPGYAEQKEGLHEPGVHAGRFS